MTDPAYLQPARYVESDAPEVVAFAAKAADGAADPVEAAVRIYYAVRDQVLYDPYQVYSRLEVYSGRTALLRGRGYCVAKAALMAACCRARGIPARLGFADVRNHLSSPRLEEMFGNGGVFTWHAYADLWLDGRFVKATPAFNLALCDRFGVRPLEFDGRSDSILHPYDRHNRRHMEYVNDRGTFADVPVERILATFREVSPRCLDDVGAAGGDFAGDGSKA